jgi:predicted TIM-barrel fold metal-dependent hydrolase
MPVVDAHVHLYPPEVGKDPVAWARTQGETHWATLCARRRSRKVGDANPGGSPVQLFPTVAELLREMDTAGVEKSVLLGWYWENPATCIWQNRFYAECVRAHPDRLAAFAAIHPGGRIATLEEIRRVRNDGLIGLGELSPHSQDIAASAPIWREILQLAGEIGLPVNLHVTDPESNRYPGRVETPLSDFVDWAREFPRTKFILAHWGGGLAFNPDSRALTNVYFDSAASPLLYGPEIWRRVTGAVGPNRVLFGSDNPLRLYPKTESGVGLSTFVQEAREALLPADLSPILKGNARRLLGL